MVKSNMAGIEDYQMYLAHQLSQEQREEWEKKHEAEIQLDRGRPRNLRLQMQPQTPLLSRQQLLQEVALAEAELQDELVVKKYVGIGVGWASLITEHLLSHPFVVLRRQCQVHNNSIRYHLVPLTLIPVILRLHQRQGITTLWKGIGSVLLIRGVNLAIEDIISKFTPWPKEITVNSSLRSVGQHIMLKCISFALVTPFYSASLVETVQSEIASERPGVFDVFKEGACRLLSWGSPQNGRMLPVWALVLPTVTYCVLKYLFGLVIQGATSRILEVTQKKEQKRRGAFPKDLTNQPPNQDIELASCLVRDVASDIVFYPFETILHRLHLQGTRTIIDNLDSGYEVIPILTSYLGTKDCLETVQHEEGVSGLYKGFGALLLQYAAHFAVVKVTKLVLTELTTLLRSSKGKQEDGSPVLQGPPSVQINRGVPPGYPGTPAGYSGTPQYVETPRTPRTPYGLSNDEVTYFYPE
ncbi:mitochondrial outer membrane protein SLC25A46-like isoform X2 [Cloeon dipterum]|uniref:mitochondrial outer membrane protein SLC25A46-like isoform X2 n=1 Tax=Cloeon dipterum TaxID=197152 RepID=UPI00321F6143